jgi:peptidyl-prolyl cis-trans isomerase SurA
MAAVIGKAMSKLAAGRRGLALALWMGSAILAAGTPASAQSQFSPAARVDGEVITSYELSQRQAFLTLLHAPGDIRGLALDQLINEKIEMREARKAGIEADEAAVQAGMEEFAARGNLNAEQLLQLLAQNGIAKETFRDFVAAGVTWRDYVKATFLPKVSISQTEVKAAMAEAVADPGLRVLLREIILPATDAATRKASMARAERLTGLEEAEFTDAAMRFSTGPSRNGGGEMKWLDITALPPAVGAAVRGLQPGQTSRIIAGEEDIRLYYMIDREEVSAAKPRTVVDYAALFLPGGRSDANLSEAQRIRERVTQCDDLYQIARNLPPEQLVREELPVSTVPAAYAAELETLDPGEISTRLTSSSGAMTVLMLCSRGNELPRSLSADTVAERLRNQRVGTMAQFFLDELRANAHIEILRN